MCFFIDHCVLSTHTNPSCLLILGVAPVKSPKIIFAQTPPLGASIKNSAYFVSDWTGDSHLTHYLTGKTMGF